MAVGKKGKACEDTGGKKATRADVPENSLKFCAGHWGNMTETEEPKNCLSADSRRKESLTQRCGEMKGWLATPRGTGRPHFHV